MCTDTISVMGYMRFSNKYGLILFRRKYQTKRLRITEDHNLEALILIVFYRKIVALGGHLYNNVFLWWTSYEH